MILSCDKYSDLWEQITKNAKEQFSDLGMPIYLVSNLADFRGDNIYVIKTGEDNNWSDSFKSALEKIDESKLLVILDDIYITKKPLASEVLRCFEILESNQLGTFHARPTPKKRRYNNNHGDWYEFSNNDEYTANVYAFWDKHSLLSILKSGESAWDFEVYGSRRLNRFYRSGAYNLSLLEMAHLIEKGEWVPEIQEIVKHLRLSISLDTRAISKKSGYSNLLRNLFFNVTLNVLPTGPRRFLLDFFRRFS